MPFAGPAPPTDASERRDGMSESEKLQNMDISALRRVDTGSDEPWHGALTTFPSAALLMICARIAGSLWNITHDCDEVFNFWEPLHFLVYGSGMQTWEYHPAFALRSWLFLLFHLPLTKVLSAVAGSAGGKVVTFYAMRAALAVCGGLCESLLVVATRKAIGKTEALVFLAMHLSAAAPFLNAGTLLSTSEAGSWVSLASALLLLRLPNLTILCGVFAVCVVWPIAALALLPMALFIVTKEPLGPALRTAIVPSTVLLMLATVVDTIMYKPQGAIVLGMWHFIKYNVIGGNSHIFGTEPPLFYLTTGLLGFNGVFLLALSSPVVVAAVAWARSKRGPSAKPSVAMESLARVDLLRVFAGVVAPPLVCLAVLSALPHKEERFMAPVHAHVSLSAAISLVWLARLLLHAGGEWPAPRTRALASGVAAMLVLGCAAFAAVSWARIGAILTYYSAPTRLFSRLHRLFPTHAAPTTATASPVSSGPVVLCMGRHWHHFPSSFFLPGQGLELAFLDRGFRGSLPGRFRATSEGWEGANDRNEAWAGQFVGSVEECDYVIEVLDSSAGETVREGSAEKRVVDFEWFVDRDAIAEPSGLMHGLQRILRLPFFGASWKQRLGAKRFALMEVALTTEQGDGEEEGEGEGEHREWEEEERVNEAGGLGDGVDEHI